MCCTIIVVQDDHESKYYIDKSKYMNNRKCVVLESNLIAICGCNHYLVIT